MVRVALALIAVLIVAGCVTADREGPTRWSGSVAKVDGIAKGHCEEQRAGFVLDFKRPLKANAATVPYSFSHHLPNLGAGVERVRWWHVA